jgi:alpha-glucosidase
MIDPGVKYEPGYFVYDSGTREDIWVLDAAGKPFIGPVWPGSCVFPDFTMPKARRWWAALYKDFLEMDIDGVWNDMNEPAAFNDLGTMPDNCFHRGGDGLPCGPHIQYHNVYGMLMVKASREGILQARPDKRPFILSRANFLGGHRYAATWTGDNKAVWEHLKWSIPMSLNLGLSGQPFSGPDIGGFDGNASPDLWAHWIALGAFYPFSRAHTVKESKDQEPWSFGPETENAARIALQRRYRLLPYLYTLFYESHKTGLPVARPVLFAQPDNLALRTEDQAFLLGSGLLVIPRWAVHPSLPSGIWRTISLVDGDTPSDPYQCELKIRGGTILPLGKVVQNTQENFLEELTLLVCLDEKGTARGTLYEDDGDGWDFEKGRYLLTEYTARKDDNSVRVQISRQEGQRPRPPRKVFVKLIAETGILKAEGQETKTITVNWND